MGQIRAFSDQISVHLTRGAKCTEIWSEEAPDLSHLTPIWPTLETNLPSLIPGGLGSPLCVVDWQLVWFVLTKRRTVSPQQRCRVDLNYIRLAVKGTNNMWLFIYSTENWWSYRSDRCIKKANIKFFSQFIDSILKKNILRHFNDEIVPFIFTNHPVLFLQEK